MDLGNIAFHWHDVAGNISYILIAASYYLTNIFWLRMLAVVGLACEILYFALSGGDMHTGIAWNIVFIAINLLQTYHLVAERWRLKSAPEAAALKQGVLSSLDDHQLARLFSTGDWRTVAPGENLTVEGEAVRELAFLVDGTANVVIEGAVVARLQPGSFVGEMAFVSGRPASATVVADVPLRVFAFEITRLKKLTAGDEQIAVAFHRIVGQDMAQKLNVSGHHAAA